MQTSEFSAVKKCRVKIWGNPLRCPVCQQDIFHFKKIKMAGHPGECEIKYLFECIHCGHGMLFGGDRVAAMESVLPLPSSPAADALNYTGS